MSHVAETNLNGQNGGWKSYIPFTDAHAFYKIGDAYALHSDTLKLGSKTVLAAAAAWAGAWGGVSLFASYCPTLVVEAVSALAPEAVWGACQILTDAVLAPAMAILAGSAVLKEENEALDQANVEAFLASPSPSFQLMQSIYESPSGMRKLLDQTASTPQLLLKTNEFEKTILSEFVEKSRFAPHQAALAEVIVAGPTALVSDKIEQNNQIVRELLHAASWPRKELVRCISALSRRYPRTLESLYEEGLLRKDDLTPSEKAKLRVSGWIRKEIKRGFKDMLGV